MVQWIDEHRPADNHGDWEVSWEGKSANFAERDGVADDGKTHRLYFLLGPGEPVPPIVRIAQTSGQTMQTNPLPAIFPPELGVSARTAGKKGVLHTVWAKRRLIVLQEEIDREMKTSVDGIGLDLAMQEREWIEENFGIGSRYAYAHAEPTSASPKSPGGSRLAEKMKGLKLGTSLLELKARSSGRLTPSGRAAFVESIANARETSAYGQSPLSNPLSPETSDVAVSSFALFHGELPRPRRAVVRPPPSHIVAQQVGSQDNNGRVASLDAVTDGVFTQRKSDDNNDDDLFAVTMSPRSPDMAKSPFSFSIKDPQR
jgi:hypothetical protein